MFLDLIHFASYLNCLQNIVTDIFETAAEMDRLCACSVLDWISNQNIYDYDLLVLLNGYLTLVKRT